MSTLVEESRMKVEAVEELLFKVKSDIIKVDRLEEEIGSLKEANGRLKKYNGDLRQALIKEQVKDPAINMPDAGKESQPFSNESVEVRQTLQNFDAVVFNPIIIDLVFKSLDVKTIKKCRSVCKNWNEAAIRILSRQNGGYGLAVRLEKEGFKGITAAIQRQTRKGLKAIVTSSPQHWFSKALLDASFTSMTEIQSVLKDFGYRLRSIEIEGKNFLFRDLHKILVDWCPNLEQLALPPYILDVRDENGQNVLEEGHQKLAFPRLLNLTSFFMQQQFFIPIVKASPKLKTLSCRPDISTPHTFNDLLTCPKVTKNLENLTLCSGHLQSRKMIEVFNSLQFSSKLKKLALIKVDQDLSEGLEKLGGTLEKLVVTLGRDIELVLPGMNNLTELRYITKWRKKINSIEFLTGMPNLTILYLGQSPNNLDKDFIEHMFSDCQQLRRNPQKKLKELYLFGIVVSPSPTFELMNTIFPNLTKLVVGLNRNCKYQQKIMKNYYEDVFKGGLSEMQNLKEIYLDFTCTCRNAEIAEERFDYMSVVFGQLNKLSNLTHLTVRDNSNLATSLVGDKLLEIPNFRRLTLIGLKLELLAAKELTMLLYKHHIQLEIKNKDVFEEFRFHVEEQLIFRSRAFCY